MHRYFKLTLLFTIGLMVSFFLPWVNVLFFDASAFQIPRYVSNLQEMAQAAGSTHRDYSSYLLYGIPVLCILGICRDVFRLKIWYWDYAGILAITLAFMGYVLVKRQDLPVSFSIGCYLTLALAVCGLVYGIVFNGNKPVAAESKSELFQELSNLQALKEKGVITAEIFETRRQELLQAIGQQQQEAR